MGFCSVHEKDAKDEELLCAFCVSDANSQDLDALLKRIKRMETELHNVVEELKRVQQLSLSECGIGFVDMRILSKYTGETDPYYAGKPE